MATKEKSAKARRLMTTPEWERILTSAELSVPAQANAPEWGQRNYDSKGFEKKQTLAEGVAKPDEQGFFSKYWLYCLLAFIVLPRLFEGGEAAPAASG